MRQRAAGLNSTELEETLRRNLRNPEETNTEAQRNNRIPALNSSNTFHDSGIDVDM